MADGLSWEDFHKEWLGLHAKLEERDARQMAVLEEIRDSIGDMHTRFETLPCQAHDIGLKQLMADVTELKRNSIHWRGLVNRKTVFAAVGGLVGLLGWDRAAKAIVELGK